MRAISAFSREAGRSTRVCFACTALRMRVSMSAIGSVMSLNLLTWICSGPLCGSLRELRSLCEPHSGPGAHRAPNNAGPARELPRHPATLGWLPAALRHPCDVALERQLAEAQATERELPDVAARPATEAAAVTEAHSELLGLRFLRNLRGRGH